MNIKDPKIQITLGLALLTVILAGLYIKFSYLPVQDNINLLTTRRNQKSDSLKLVRGAVAKLPQVEAEYQVLLKKWEKAQELLPTEKQIPTLIKQITHAGIESGVVFNLIKPGELASATVLSSSINVDMSLLGGYHQFCRFLSQLGNLPRIVIPGKMKLMKNADETKTVKVDFSVMAYVFKSGGKK